MEILKTQEVSSCCGASLQIKGFGKANGFYCVKCGKHVHIDDINIIEQTFMDEWIKKELT